MSIVKAGVMPIQMSGLTAAPAMYTLMIYDFMLLFGQECRLIYTPGWNAVKVAYLCCRFYPMLIWPFFIWTWMGNHTFETCARIQTVRQLLMLPMTLAPQAVMIIRAWAFTDRNRTVLFVLCVFLCSLVGCQIWIYSQIEAGTKLFEFYNTAGCFNDNSTPKGRQATKRIGLILLFSSLLDLVAVFVMLWHYFRTRHLRSPLGFILVRQAVTIFIIIAVLNAIAAASYLSTVFPAILTNMGLVFVLTVPNVLACRLLVQLRKHVSPSDSKRRRDISRVVREAFPSTET
ncbi:hypothetical protein BDN72DRAFT_456445 [Pluteus cervinus]|uniref:Uncharacterized protein n=1 Tax=Pluteus cervinus TaxID=181527 RepID=A0ACD3B0T4_9AGAR|nr:hypothetical protein BDN72DRAFT_456445 [Pluteus cervinus]